MVWLIACRPDTTHLERVIEALPPGLTVQYLHLEGLDPAAIEQLAADRLGDAVDGNVRHLLTGADGVPFLAVALLEGLAARLPQRRRSGGGPIGSRIAGLPESLVLGVRARLESLPAQSVRLLRIGSVLGRSFTVADAAALLDGAAEVTVLPWLEAAVRAGVIEDTGERIVFRHDLLREAVYADVPASVRQGLHRAAARQMVVSGRGPLDAATHVLRSASVGDLEAVDILRRAAEQADDTAPSVAGELASCAFSLLSPTDAALWVEAGMEAHTRLNATGRGAEALVIADRLLMSGLDNELAARVQIEVAHSMWTRGELDQICSRVDPASALLDLTAGTRAHLLALRIGPLPRSGSFGSGSGRRDGGA